jgi:hypothetical protein
MSVWATGVVKFAGHAYNRATLGLQPADPEQYEMARVRLARVGFKRISRAELARDVWPTTAPTTRVYLAGRVFSHLHTGATRLQPSNAMTMTERWLACAREQGAVLVMLFRPGTFPDIPEADEVPVPVDLAAAVVEDLADQRLLFAGLMHTAEIPS